MTRRLRTTSWLDDHTDWLWWIVAYLAVVVFFAALGHVFGASLRGSNSFPGSD